MFFKVGFEQGVERIGVAGALLIVKHEAAVVFVVRVLYSRELIP